MSSEDDEGQGVQKYADFLRQLERKFGPDGFVDSSSLQKSYYLRASKKDNANDRPLKNQGLITVVDLSTKMQKDQRESDKRVKLIEDHMWHHKQEERELKRVEGDIIKNQRTVRKSLRDYENTITRKKMTETKKLNQSLDKYSREQIVYNQGKEEKTKSRIENNIQAEQAKKDLGRKSHLTTSQITRQYRTKLDELELRRHELSRISVDFENKIQKKEEEQFKLQQDLAELAIVLNMEAQKGSRQKQDFEKNRKKLLDRQKKEDHGEENKFENKQAKSSTDLKQAENQRRRLSASLGLTRSHLAVKHREEGRHLQDTENRLRGNVNEQKHLNDATMLAELDQKAKQNDHKLVEHENRRRIIAFRENKQRKKQNDTHEIQYAEKFKKRYSDQVRREHEDGLKFFQKMVNKGEEREQALYNRVRSSEYNRQRQEQVVKRLQKTLNEAKKQNAQKLKQEMAEKNKKEIELEQQLIREQAILNKAHAQREESYTVLQEHRRGLEEDKHHLTEHEREHQRLMRLSQSSSTQVPAY